MAPPLLVFAIVVLGKKAAALALYKAGARYGWPRVYRKALEYNRRLTRGRAAQRGVAASIAALFRFPSAATAEAAARTASVREYVLASAASVEQSMPLLRGRITALAASALDAPATWWGWVSGVAGRAPTLPPASASRAASEAGGTSRGIRDQEGGGKGGVPPLR